jgi:glutamyl/glutaminyl-tRNA synthetase
MEISHVIRGEEWIPSTPKHLLLYQALGWEPTQFAHLPLILNPDKSKLSKRQGDVSVEEFLAKGYLPEALLNFVAFLGWNPKTEKEIFSLGELIKEFNLANVNKAGAVFDLNKLDWFNSQYIKLTPDSELAEKLIPFWKENGIEIGKFNKNYLAAVANLEKERLKKLSEIGEMTAYFFIQPEYEASLLIWKKSDVKDAKLKLSTLIDLFTPLDGNKFNATELETTIKKFISDNGFDNGSVLWPLRTALTGMEKSPGPFEVCATLALGLGKKEILNRLENAIKKLSE